MKWYKIAGTATVVLLVAMIIRIAYVNLTYPYAGMRQIKEGNEIKGNKYTIEISEADVYSKSGWLKKIEGFQVAREEEANNVQYYKAANKDKIPDYYVGYNPQDDYEVVELNVKIKNTTGEDLKISLKKIITLAREMNSQSEFMDSYYTDQINEKLSGSKFKGMLKEGEEVSVKLIFICDSSVDEMYAESIELGNNQIMKLDLTRK